MTLCGFCILAMGGCDIFSAPLRLFSELLPIAIKYAPYALMFLEAPSGKDTTETAGVSENDASGAPMPGAMEPLPQLLERAVARKTSGCVFALYLETENLERVIQNWQREHPQYKVHYAVTYCDFSSDIHYRQVQNILEEHRIEFLATGPLDTLSTVSSERKISLLAALAGN